jgi:pimeloyl-ACP methyl ester carboxylesterase
MTERTSTGVAYDDRGKGDVALLFLPGWCGPRSLFEPLVAPLEGRVRSLVADWRGHGDSAPAAGDFGFTELADDATAVIEHSGAERVVPVAASHGGWVAIELRRRLGAQRVPRLVFLDWMVLGAPEPFLDALGGMMNPASTRDVVDRVTEMWTAGLDIPTLTWYVGSMAATDDRMWARAAREITGAFERFGSPLSAVAALEPPPPTLHLYAQPRDDEYLDAQRGFAAEHPWFQVVRLDAASHFPMFEVPDAIAGLLHNFAAQ